MRHNFHYSPSSSIRASSETLDRSERKFLTPFPFVFEISSSELDNPDLIGFFVYLVPFMGPHITIEGNYYYTHGLSYKKLLFSHIADGDEGIEAFSKSEEEKIAIEISEPSNYSILNARNRSIIYRVDGGDPQPRYGINYLDFDFQPELKENLKGEIRVGNYSLSYIAVDDLRYMLSDVIANPEKKATLSISGAKIQPWINISADENIAKNTNEDTAGRGYFTLKLELAVNEVVSSLSDDRRDRIESINVLRDQANSGDLTIDLTLGPLILDARNFEAVLSGEAIRGASLPRLLMSIPCPPVWHPSRLVNKRGLSTEEIVALYRNFGSKAIPRLMKQQSRIPEFEHLNSPPIVQPAII